MKWEYRREMHTSSDVPLVDWLNAMGSDGWQLCAVVDSQVSYVYFFRREVTK